MRLRGLWNYCRRGGRGAAVAGKELESHDEEQRVVRRSGTCFDSFLFISVCR